ncbi:hypothetical protein SUDANB105_07853 [Streptomyces sp. enrichment culture]
MRWFGQRAGREVDELQRRVLAWVQHGNPDRIMGRGAEQCAARVRSGIHEGVDPMHALGAVVALASWRWHRHRYLLMAAALTADEAALGAVAEELGLAVDYFRVIQATAPGLVPDEVRHALERRAAEQPSREAVELLKILRPAARIVEGIENQRRTSTEYPREVLKPLRAAARIVKQLDRGGIDRVDEAADLLEQALVLLPEEHPRYPAVANMLATVLVRRGAVRRFPDDLDAALNLAESAAETGDPTFVATLADVLHTRHSVGGDDRDLDRAIDVQRTLTDTNPEQLFTLAQFLHTRLERTGNDVDLAEAEELAGRLADVATGLERADALNLLGVLATYRYETTSDRAHLEAALAHQRKALALARKSDKHVVYLTNLAWNLHRLYQLSDDPGLLVEAVALARDAVALPHQGDPGVDMSLAQLLYAEHERTGATGPLDEAIRLGRAALGEGPQTASDWAGRAGSLGLLLHRRYRLTDQSELLEEAVVWLRRAVEDSPLRSARRLNQLSNLAMVLTDLHHPDTDEEAAGLLQEALETSPADGVNRSLLLSNLAGVLVRLGRYREAADAARESLRLAPEKGAGWAMTADNLAVSLQRTGDPADLEEAIRWGEAAMTASPAGHVGHGSIRFNQALRLAERSAPPDLTAAYMLWREVAADPASSIYLRLDSARAWARESAGEQLGGSEALDAYAAYMELLPRRVWRGLRRSDAEALIARLPGLTCDAAANALAAGRPRLAVEYLEQGRVLLWSRLLEGQSDLAGLSSAWPTLAARFAELRAALDAEPGGVKDPLGADRRLALAREFEDLIEQIRGLPGQSRFLRPAGIERVGDEGPVVLLNVSRWRCDALIIERDEIRTVPLPDLTDNEVARWADEHLESMKALDAASGDPLVVINAERRLAALLRRLSETVTGPVLDSFPERPRRIWWCPTGPLTMLPLHAASGDTVCSILPSLRALAQARKTPPATPGDLLIIAVPKAPNADPLPNVDAEQEFLTGVFPDYTLLRNARRESARHALSRHMRVHFACHATQNLVSPSEAGFVLQDGLLSLTDLLAQPPSHGELAVLSACKTATGGIAHLDEAITLANALHHTGWRHVVATQFSVWDDAAARFTELLYPLLSEHADPAEAVHAAVRILRDAHPNSPSRWAPYVHTGP